MTAAHYLVEAVFWIFMVTTVMGGLLAVKARILMHIVLGLALAFLGVAGLYAYLGSMFLAVMQILIYLGAICIVLVFGIMVGYTPVRWSKEKSGGRTFFLRCPRVLPLLFYCGSLFLNQSGLLRLSGVQILAWKVWA